MQTVSQYVHKFVPAVRRRFLHFRKQSVLYACRDTRHYDFLVLMVHFSIVLNRCWQDWVARTLRAKNERWVLGSPVTRSLYTAICSTEKFVL